MPNGYIPVNVIAEKSIANTWGQRCNHLIYYSSGKPRAVVEKAEWVLLNESIDERRWTACREALIHLARHYIDDYQWFLLAEDDTYVIVDNLVYFLAAQDVTYGRYLGHAIHRWGTDYNVIGAGVVLNRNSLRRLHSHLIKGHCVASSLAADPILGQCLDELGIRPEDTRDSLNRARFLLYHPQLLLVPESLPWRNKFWSQSKYPSVEVNTIF